MPAVLVLALSVLLAVPSAFAGTFSGTVPAAGSTVSAVPIVSVTVADAVPVAGTITMSIDGVSRPVTISYAAVPGHWEFDEEAEEFYWVWPGTDYTNATVSCSPGALANGGHTVSVSQDSAGGAAPFTHSWSFTLSKPAPTFSAAVPAQGAALNSVPTSISVSAAWCAPLSGTFVLTVNGQARTCAVSYPTSGGSTDCTHATIRCSSPGILPDGTQTARITFTPANGDPAASYSWAFGIAEKPKIGAPLAPAAGATVTSARPEISARVTDNGTIASVALSLDGTPVSATYDASAKVMRATPGFDLSNGSHTVVASATDTGGNTATATWSFCVSAPVTTFSGRVPAPGATLTSIPTSVSFDAVSTVSLADDFIAHPLTSVTADGANIPWALYQPTGDVTSAHLVAYLPASLPDGPHSVGVSLGTGAGTTAHDSWSFTLAVAPTLGEPVPAPGSLVSTVTPAIRVPASDNSGVTGASATVDGQPAQATLSGGAVHVALSEPFADDTLHTVSVTVTDAGNRSASRTWSFTTQTNPEMSSQVDDCLLCHVEPHPTYGTECSECHDPSTPTQIPYPHLGAPSSYHTPADAADCRPCHVTAITVEHARRGLTCESCHRSTDSAVVSAIATGNTRCSACHIIAGHEALHTTTVPESCSGTDCHTGTSLTTIHINENTTRTCDTCHESTDPVVQGAIASHDKRCSTCHGSAHADSGSHRVHIDASIPRGPGGLVCGDCHDTDAMPLFKDGLNLAQTTVCNTCHSPGGSFDGVDSVDGSVGAKDHWASGVYDTMTTTPRPGNERWCVGCHDEIPAIIGGAPALNKAGDGATFGYFVTGHGRETTYPAGSYQALSDAGNKAAGKQCTACHEAGLPHINVGVQSDRLMPGIENDLDDSNCRACHDSGEAVSSPAFYTDYVGFKNSAHGRFKCTDCHDPHGAPGGGTQMTAQSDICGSCHSAHAGHAVGASFGKGGKSYKLQCTSCHNIHVLTGLTSPEEPSKSAVTRFTNNTEVWGDQAGEKMTDFAASGTYRTPQGEDLAGTQIPDYVTFCLDCHGTPQSEFGAHGSITWSGDNHGLVSANVPNGYGTAPNWYTYGQAEGWDGDDVVSEEDAWPVLPRGRGEQIWTRSVYNQEERIEGANFVLSCTNCHDSHAAGSQKLKSIVNGANYTGDWKTLCNACHYYYSDWHAGMSCGNANSCHNDPGRNPRAQGYSVSPQSIHGMPHATGDGSRRTWDGDLVFDLRFDNNLKDASDFQLDSKWFNQPGSFVAGKSGQAISLNGDQSVQVGTENDHWSTDEGYHGTWKYTEMKYNTTMEAWVNPSDSTATEYTVFTKHVGHNDGGYTLALKKIDGTWRAVLNVNVSGTGAGVRGAYSTVDIPVGRWTHVAASFDRNGPDRDPLDLSAGRIRIYVDGEDVTTSDASGTMMQPGAGEDFIFPYSAHSYPGDLQTKDNPYGYDGHWCASEFTVGGFDWQNGFVGSIDQAKLWNVTKPAEYFEAADQAAAPRITGATGRIGGNQITVRFSEGVFTSAGSMGALQASDFTLTDTDNSRSVVGVDHIAGQATATLTLSSPLDDVDDLNVDLLAPAAASIYDEYNNMAPATAVIIAPSGQTPVGEIRFELNEAPGATYASDTSGFVTGRVYGSGALNGSSFAGDGTGNYIEFANNTSALQTETTMTIEARIKPEGFGGATGTVVQRVLGRAGSTGNYQTSVWRIIDSTNWPNYHPAAGEASIALWVRVQDAHGGDVWKPVLTEATDAGSLEYHPVVSGHWYRMKVVWNTYKSGGVEGQPFVPAAIYLDDEGTDGLGAGERWAGYVDATDADQSQHTANRKLCPGDKILSEAGPFRIGANTPGLGNYFTGEIDWVSWSPAAD